MRSTLSSLVRRSSCARPKVEPGGLGIGAKALGWAGKQWLRLIHREGDRLETEKADLRRDLNDLLRMLEDASTKAQMAVNASSNDPAANEAHVAAVEKATQACQRVANLFQVEPGAILSEGFMRARLDFRERTTDEDNPSLMDRIARRGQCEHIERACATFFQEISTEAFRRYGQGIGPRAGVAKGRKVKR